MSDLAGLLRDVRIALRRAVPGFEHQPLSRRLDAAIDAADAPPPPAAKVEPHDIHAPGKVILQMVAAGRREFSPEQRDWCVGEAMVLTGFKQDPAELLSGGDQALATLVMSGGRR
ncbi:MAG TPA: hypothetical protein VFM73_00115 [Xanthomonadaceae bacterium]|nr:hypothetical protein [Xanthomonadaceae bacterium]